MAALLVLLAANRRAQLGLVDALSDNTESLPDGQQEQGQGSVAADWLAAIDPASWMPTMTDDSTASANLAAMLMTIRVAEGTAGDNGYRTMFGGRLFDSYADHPRKPMQFTDQKGRRLWSSAAGAYQFMAVSPIPGGSTSVDTWDRLKRKLGLPDFSPASQDAAAIELIDEQGALQDVEAGRFDAAIAKLRPIWASLPGAGYGQPEQPIERLRTAFVNAGGTLA